MRIRGPGRVAPERSLCGGAGAIRQRLFAWALARFSARLDAQVASHKSRLFRGLSGTLVEIGPGVGANLPYFSQASKWIGVEPNRFMQERLTERSRSVGLNAELRIGSAEHIPVADNTVDAVISTLVLCCVVDQSRALGEVLRVLKPGGKFLFIEHVAAARGTSLRRLQGWLRPLWSRLGDGCHPDRETWAALQQAGFAEVSFEQFRVPVPIVSPHIAGIAVKSGA
jgi:ubiquinone/menaquinone biosynthesis C-methylase UbiE